MRIPGVLLLLIVGTAMPLAGQALWRMPGAATTFGLDLQKPWFQGTSLDDDNFVLTASADVRVASGVALSVAVPVSSAVGSSKNAIGNPWLGIEVNRSGVTYAVGVRPSLGQDDAEFDNILIGLVTDFDHYEAWATTSNVFRGLVRMGTPRDAGVSVTGFAGGTVIGASGPGSRAVALFDYGLRASYGVAHWLASAGVTGRYRLTGQDAADGHSVHQVFVALEGMTGRLRPMASVRFYVDPIFHGGNSDGSDRVLQVGFVVRP